MVIIVSSGDLDQSILYMFLITGGFRGEGGESAAAPLFFCLMTLFFSHHTLKKIGHGPRFWLSAEFPPPWEPWIRQCSLSINYTTRYQIRNLFDYWFHHFKGYINLTYWTLLSAQYLGHTMSDLCRFQIPSEKRDILSVCFDVWQVNHHL